MSVECKDLTKKFDGKMVLDHWTASIPDSGITVMMGPSGVGKTTLIRLLAGLDKADSGEITGLNGKKLSVVFQEDRLFPQLSVVENMEVAGSGAEQWLGRLGLAEAAGLYPKELSGGMKRRVSIGRALCRDGDVFLLDEPFQGLDDSTKSDVMDIFRQIKAKKTILLVTHDQREADYLADHILRL